MTSLSTALNIRELNHIALYVRDVDASAHFYGDVLALPRLRRPDFPFAGAWFALGSQELHLIQADLMRQACSIINPAPNPASTFLLKASSRIPQAQ